jgi:uncharacterized protein (DUF362 family)
MQVEGYRLPSISTRDSHQSTHKANRREVTAESELLIASEEIFALDSLAMRLVEIQTVNEGTE